MNELIEFDRQGLRKSSKFESEENIPAKGRDRSQNGDSEKKGVEADAVYSWKDSVKIAMGRTKQGAPDRIFRIKTPKATTPKNGQYVAGIKVHDDKIYLTIPRGILRGIHMPVNLAFIDKPTSALQQGDLGSDPIFRPYPDLKHQKFGDCGAFQFIMGFEIDNKGILWLPDNGWFYGSRKKPCLPKMIHLDSKTNKIKKVYKFPRRVVERGQSSLLNDIVVDVDTQIGYISNSMKGEIVL